MSRSARIRAGRGWLPRTVIAIAFALAGAVSGGAVAQAQELKIGGTGASLGTMRLLAQAFVESRPHMQTRLVVLPSMGSGGGIKAVLAGAIQIAVSSRPLTDAERAAGGVEVEYGRTPFVFATSTANKVQGITTRNLVDFYAGTVDQWPDGAKLRLVLRPIGDSDSEAIKAMSPAMREAKTAAEQRKGMLFTVTDQETASNIEKIPGALGPSTLALMLSEKRALKALALDGVEASVDSIASGRYALYKRLALVLGPASPPEARDFVAFARSAAGIAILRQNGHLVP